MNASCKTISQNATQYVETALLQRKRAALENVMMETNIRVMDATDVKSKMIGVANINNKMVGRNVQEHLKESGLMLLAINNIMKNRHHLNLTLKKAPKKNQKIVMMLILMEMTQFFLFLLLLLLLLLLLILAEMAS